MRADRLVSLVLLLRHRGRLSGREIARELEVSTRTVLRDIEALSAAGVPVYAERGRHGGFELRPGFRAELTGLNHEEALALLTAGSLGLGSALDSAMRKVIDAIPDGDRVVAGDAAARILIEPSTDLLSRAHTAEQIAPEIMTEVRRAVTMGHQLKLDYAAAGEEARVRTVDPLGLVTVRGTGYLLALADGQDRTYRLSRIQSAAMTSEPARRPSEVDLGELWRRRSSEFRSGGDQLSVSMRLHPDQWEQLADTALAVSAGAPGRDGWLVLEVAFQDERHAVWALWQFGRRAEALAPASLREALRDRALELASTYQSF